LQQHSSDTVRIGVISLKTVAVTTCICCVVDHVLLLLICNLQLENK